MAPPRGLSEPLDAAARAERVQEGVLHRRGIERTERRLDEEAEHGAPVGSLLLYTLLVEEAAPEPGGQRLLQSAETPHQASAPVTGRGSRK